MHLMIRSTADIYIENKTGILISDICRLYGNSFLRHAKQKLCTEDVHGFFFWTTGKKCIKTNDEKHAKI